MQISVEETLRYLGAAQADAATRAAAEQAAQALSERLTPRWLYRVCALQRRENEYFLSEANVSLTGTLADRLLAECHHAALLICTLGADFEAMLRTWQVRDMAQAVLLDACGSVYVEAGCDAAEAELRAQWPDAYLTDRFSPGYGDLPLALQGPILTALAADKRLGVYITKAWMLNPAKTVTAVIGLADRPQQARIRGCAYCALQGRCALRERGRRCEL